MKTKEESRKQNKEWRDANPDKMEQYMQTQKEAGNKGYNKEYYAANVEAFKQRQYKSNAKHKEKRQAYYKAYYIKNKEKLLKYQKDLRESKEAAHVLKNGIEKYDPKTKTFK